MQLANRAEFEERMKLLCAGFNVPATTERLEAYWLGLAKMQLSVFVRVVEYALGESGPEKLPTPKLLWVFSKQSRPQTAVQGPPPPEVLGYEPTEWQLLANRIGIRYAIFGRDEAKAREAWKALRRIGAQFELLAADHDPEATPKRMAEMIVAEFRRIAGMPQGQRIPPPKENLHADVV